MSVVTTVIIGAGQCGLAMSRELSRRSVDHVVLERGRIANSWHADRWDSLRLLTPNWMSAPAGHIYGGTDPDGFMTCADFAASLAGSANGLPFGRYFETLPFHNSDLIRRIPERKCLETNFRHLVRFRDDAPQRPDATRLCCQGLSCSSPKNSARVTCFRWPRKEGA